jgi:FAD dependent monooxygenase
MSPALVTSDHYQVAIVGGGIAGLTLALAFERLNISFVLFEARDSITPDQGASIGLLPNGLRILEQLGVLEDIEKQTSPLKTWNHLDCNGDLIAAVDALGYYQERYQLLSPLDI